MHILLGSKDDLDRRSKSHGIFGMFELGGTRDMTIFHQC